MAAVRVPYDSKHQLQQFLITIRYLMEAQLPFIQTVYDFVVLDREIIMFVRRPEMTISDFIEFQGLNDNQKHITIYCIAAGIFMAHRHRMRAGQFTLRDVLIFENSYVSLSAELFLRVSPCCWSPKCDLLQLSNTIIQMIEPQKFGEFNLYEQQKCGVCGQPSFKDDSDFQAQTVFLQCSTNTSSSFRLVQLIFETFKWSVIFPNSFLQDGRIATQVDDSIQIFNSMPCLHCDPSQHQSFLSTRNRTRNQDLYRVGMLSNISVMFQKRNYASIEPKNAKILMGCTNMQNNYGIDSDMLMQFFMQSDQKNENETQVDPDPIDLDDDKNFVSKPLPQYLQETAYQGKGPMSKYAQLCLAKKQQMGIDGNNDEQKLDKESFVEMEDMIYSLDEEQEKKIQGALTTIIEGKNPATVIEYLMVQKILLQSKGIQFCKTKQDFPLNCQPLLTNYTISNGLFPESLENFNLDQLMSEIQKHFDYIKLLPEGPEKTAALLLASTMLLILLQSFILKIYKEKGELILKHQQYVNITERKPHKQDNKVKPYDQINITEQSDKTLPDDSMIKQILANVMDFMKISISQIYAFSLQPVSSQNIFNFIDQIQCPKEVVDCNAQCLIALIDLISFSSAFQLDEKGDDVSKTSLHFLINYRQNWMPQRNSLEQIQQQQLFQNISLTIGFYLLNKMKGTLGSILLNNLIQPDGFKIVSNIKKQFYIYQQPFVLKNMHFKYSTFDEGTQQQQMFATFNGKYVTTCNCSNHKDICKKCTAILNNQKQTNQKVFDYMSQTPAKSYLIDLLVGLMTEEKRMFVDSFQDYNIKMLLTSVLDKNTSQLAKMLRTNISGKLVNSPHINGLIEEFLQGQLPDIQNLYFLVVLFDQDYLMEQFGNEFFTMNGFMTTLHKYLRECTEAYCSSDVQEEAKQDLFLKSIALIRLATGYSSIIQQKIQDVLSDVKRYDKNIEQYIQLHQDIDFNDMDMVSTQLLKIEIECVQLLVGSITSEKCFDILNDYIQNAYGMIKPDILNLEQPGTLDQVFVLVGNCVQITKEYSYFYNFIGQCRQQMITVSQVTAQTPMIMSAKSQKTFKNYSIPNIQPVQLTLAKMFLRPDIFDYGFSWRALKHLASISCQLSLPIDKMQNLFDPDFASYLLSFVAYDEVFDYFVKLMMGLRLASKVSRNSKLDKTNMQSPKVDYQGGKERMAASMANLQKSYTQGASISTVSQPVLLGQFSQNVNTVKPDSSHASVSVTFSNIQMISQMHGVNASILKQFFKLGKIFGQSFIVLELPFIAELCFDPQFWGDSEDVYLYLKDLCQPLLEAYASSQGGKIPHDLVIQAISLIIGLVARSDESDVQLPKTYELLDMVFQQSLSINNLKNVLYIINALVIQGSAFEMTKIFGERIVKLYQNEELQLYALQVIYNMARYTEPQYFTEIKIQETFGGFYKTVKDLSRIDADLLWDVLQVFQFLFTNNLFSYFTKTNLPDQLLNQLKSQKQEFKVLIINILYLARDVPEIVSCFASKQCARVLKALGSFSDDAVVKEQFLALMNVYKEAKH